MLGSSIKTGCLSSLAPTTLTLLSGELDHSAATAVHRRGKLASHTPGDISIKLIQPRGHVNQQAMVPCRGRGVRTLTARSVSQTCNSGSSAEASQPSCLTAQRMQLSRYACMKASHGPAMGYMSKQAEIA